MKRVVILGPGASGKSTLAERLGRAHGLPVIEVDQVFWQPGLVPTPSDEWAARQQQLSAAPAWIMDGDLGRYDVLQPRLAAADTVIVLDISRWRCAWRALWRSRERADFWLWLWSWRRRSKPRLLAAISAHAPTADLYLLRSPAEVAAWLGAGAAGRKA
jgi:adenylate kinase family enzyme